MKAIIEFNLPEERDEFEMCANAGNYMCVLNSLDNSLRSKIKHDSTLNKAEVKAYEEVRKLIGDLCMEYEVKIS